jgi:hypothetical protein
MARWRILPMMISPFLSVFYFPDYPICGDGVQR